MTNDGKLVSSVFMNYADEAGDNYQLGATIHKKKGKDEPEDVSDMSGVLTVWRKRNVNVWAMKKANDDVYANDPNGIPYKFGDQIGAFKTAILPGPNFLSDTFTIGGDDQRKIVGADSIINAGANGVIETQLNSSGGNPNSLYPSDDGTKTSLLAALREGYANPDPNHNAYIDIIVTDKELDLTPRFSLNFTTLEWAQYLNDELHGSGPSHADNSYDIVGVSNLHAINKIGKFSATQGRADIAPHAGIAVSFIYATEKEVFPRTNPPKYKSTSINNVVVHELGHLLLGQKMGITIHSGIILFQMISQLVPSGWEDRMKMLSAKHTSNNCVTTFHAHGTIIQRLNTLSCL